MYSHKLLKRFVKDYSLPIQVVQEPYFTYFMDLYNKQYKTKEKFKILETAVNQFDSDEEFLDEYYIIRDKIITFIESTEIYKEYNSMKMDKFNVPNNNYSSNDIFKMNNVGREFISIDLKKANFQALRFFSEEIVLNCRTYEELIGKFTTLEYMQSSKYLRQVILGNMNPKRQVKIERYLTEQILNMLLENSLLEKEHIKMVCNDEIIFDITEKESTFKLSLDNIIKNRVKERLDLDVDVEIYKLDNIGNEKYFVREFINKEGYELMCVPLVYHAQIFKKYNNLSIEDMDLVFYYENQVCKFINSLDLEN